MKSVRKVKVFVFKFRPSSHSDEYTIIAKYQTVEEAKKVREAVEKVINDFDSLDVDWTSDDAYTYCRDKEVVVTVYTAGDLDPLINSIKTIKPSSVEYYTEYQELLIRVEVPEGATLAEAMLLFDTSEAAVARFLTENCGEPEGVKVGDKYFLQWSYAGDGIYDGDHVISAGGATLDVSEHRRWSVECD